MRLITLVSIILMPLLMATSVSGETKPTTMTLKTFSVVSVFHLPPWEKKSLDQTRIFRDQGKTAGGNDIFIYEMIPANQSFDDWQTLYAVTAERPLSGSPWGYAQGLVKNYERNCSRIDAADLPRLGDDVAHFMILCASYKDRPDTGEIAVFNMQLQNGTLVKNYIHRRVPAFDLDQKTSLSLSREDLAELIAAVGGLRLIAGPN